MRKLLFLMIFLAVGAAAFGRSTQKVTFNTKLHCENCVKKVVENVSFIRGVKDLDVSLKKQQIMVVFDPSKTSVETLAKEIKKLGYPAEVAPAPTVAPAQSSK